MGSDVYSLRGSALLHARGLFREQRDLHVGSHLAQAYGGTSCFEVFTYSYFQIRRPFENAGDTAISYLNPQFGCARLPAPPLHCAVRFFIWPLPRYSATYRRFCV
jgi:hypothetical protein